MRRPPIQSILQLVTEVGYARTTLWQYWDREIRNDSDFRLHDFMDWVLLCRAASLRSRGETRVGVAAVLGIDPRTLAHRVLRLTGMPMSQFDTLGEGKVFEQFLGVCGTYLRCECCAMTNRLAQLSLTLCQTPRIVARSTSSSTSKGTNYERSLFGESR